MRRSPLALLVALAAAGPLAAQQCGDAFVEGFTALSNVGAWGWANSVVQANLGSGGNPGSWLRSSTMTTPLPILHTQDPASPFGGDWRAAGVTSIGVDLFAVDLDVAQCGRVVSVQLRSDAGTPGSPNDDLWVLHVGTETIPCKDADWRSYTVDVPAQSTTLPPGWVVTSNGGLPLSQVWDALIQDVTVVEWMLGDPGIQHFASSWILGADNPRVGYQGGPSTYCTAQHSSQGCSPALTWAGQPSASSASPFFVNANQLELGVPGIFIYGPAPGAIPLFGGTVCVRPPFVRLPVQTTTGPPGSCKGFLTVDFNAHVQSGVDPSLVAGAVVHLQAWSRDSGPGAGSSLSNALRWTLCP